MNFGLAEHIAIRHSLFRGPDLMRARKLGMGMVQPMARGPELPPEITEWLDAGGDFPEHIEIELYQKSTPPRKAIYEILDRDQNGHIEQLKNSRRGKKGFVLKVRDASTGRDLAAKLTIPDDYDDGHFPFAELDHSAKLRSASEFIHLLEGVGRVERLPNQPNSSIQRPWVCFLSLWLDGSTLEECLEVTPSRITPAIIPEICSALFRAVMFLEGNGLKHDDLHLGNLMLVPTDPLLRAIDPFTPTERIVVIDLGSVKPIDRLTFKKDDDWSSLAKCLVCLHNFLHKDRRIATRHHMFLRRLAEFIEKLSDDDVARHFPEPSDYIRCIHEMESALTIPSQRTLQFHPFDAISAEHLANDELLLKLFVEYLPWIDMVKTTEPSVLIGPRGCGKSMVFRFLSIRPHIVSASTLATVLDKHIFFGVYIGCASDLGNDLLWIAREQGRATRLASSIVTYFNLLLCREILRSLAACNAAPDVARELQIAPNGVAKIISFIHGEIGDEFNIVLLKGSDALQSAADIVDRIRLCLNRDLLAGRGARFSLSTIFIRDLCRTITAVIPGLCSRRITFLLDDYTSHRLSPEIQRILNTVIWQRDPSFIFKVSSEPHGFDAGHLDNARIDPNREFTQVDAGELSIASENSADRRSFISQLLDKRLEAAGYAGRTSTLIGNSAYKNDKDLAEAIRANKAGQKYFYYGIHVIADAWSGDVATVLHMLREMFARAGVLPQTTTLIQPKDQHQSVVQVSKALIERIRGYHPYGPQMSLILSNLGQLARRLLIDAPDRASKRSGEPVIHRKYRLELSLPPGRELDAMLRELPDGETLVQLKQELIRRAILIELRPSRGKEGEGRPTCRWQIRASLLPHFGTSLTRRGYIDIKRVEDFADLLLHPSRFCDQAYIRYGKPLSLGGLFDDLLGDDDD